MPFWKAGKNDDQVLDELKEMQKQNADEFVKKQEHADEAQKSSLIIDNNFTPVEYDPQYILQVNHLKKYFPIKGGMVSKTVGYVKAVDGVTFNLKRGTTMGLVGESGCGKTTLLRILLGLESADSGTVTGVETPAAVFQEDRLCPQLTAVQNVELVLPEGKTQYKKQIVSDFQRFGYDEQALTLPARKLSGGQKRRAALLLSLIHIS